MAVAGSLTYDTKIDKSGFEKGINNLKNSTGNAFSQIKNIVAGLGIDKLISASFNIINNSIDGAISRLDTLNNYPKVMSNLGIASDDAKKSIQKMSDKLSGLPTTLDQGALAVQRFTSKNSDVGKSTDYFLALNNALLAGGASADIQSTALEQLSQSYAKGKPDMMEWRSIQTAMPAQLNQIAKSFGMTSDQLGEALRNGKISMDDFMDKIVELNQNGTGEFQSFEEQARNSTGGIATSITVAKTQVVKGVADIISKIDELLKNEGLGGIGEIISNIGKKAKEVLDKIAEKLPDIINFLKRISPLLVSIVAGFTAYKVVLMAISAIQFVSKIGGMLTAFIKLIPAIKSVKDAMLLLNMTFAVNPIVLIVAAIVALVAGFIYLWNTSEGFRNFWIGLWENIKSAFETAWNAIVTFFTETIPNAFQSLKDKLSEIGNSIVTFFQDLWNDIVSFFTETIPQWIQNVINWFANLPYQIGYQIGQILGNIIQFGQNVWNWITNDLPQIIQSIIDWFAQLPGRIWDWLCNTVNNIIQWGQNVYNTASSWISNTINNIINWFAQLPGRIWTWLLNTIQKVVNWGRDMANKGRQGAQDLFNNIVNTVKSLPGQMLNIGKNIVQGLWNGIINAKNWIVGKVKSFAKGILDGMKNALGIHSPSKVFRDQVGKFIPQGIAVGIEADTDSALKAIDNMNDDIMDEMNRAVAFETGSINANASIKSNNNIMNIMNANLKTGIQSIENNKEIVVNATTNLDGKVLTSTVNRVNAKQKLQYGIA